MASIFQIGWIDAIIHLKNGSPHLLYVMVVVGGEILLFLFAVVAGGVVGF
jgi:hypothetical protein